MGGLCDALFRHVVDSMNDGLRRSTRSNGLPDVPVVEGRLTACVARIAYTGRFSVQTRVLRPKASGWSLLANSSSEWSAQSISRLTILFLQHDRQQMTHQR